MSESAGKTFRGLQEAYTSIYADKSENLTDDTIVSEVQEEQEFEINEEALYESIIQYLIEYGFASNEKKAAAMLPHMSEQWADAFVANYVLSECFEAELDALIKEGKDLSGYTWNELYEGYCSNATENLNEAVPLAIPMVSGGIGLLGGLANLAKDMQRMQRRKPATTGPSTWDYGQSGTSTYKPKPTPVVKAEDPSASNAIPRSNRTDAQRDAATKARQQAQSTSAPGPGGGGGDNGDNEPPKKPQGPRWLRSLKQGIKQGFQKLSAKKDADKAAKELDRATRATQPNRVTQYIGDKLVTKGIPLAKNVALGALGAGVLGAVDQFGAGGVVGKITRDVFTNTSKLGRKYDELMGRKEEKPTPTAKPSSRNPYGL